MKKPAGHDRAVLALCFDSSGEVLYSAGEDGRIVAWTAAGSSLSGSTIQRFEAPVLGLAWAAGELWGLMRDRVVGLIHSSVEVPLPAPCDHIRTSFDARLLVVGDTTAISWRPGESNFDALAWRLPAGVTSDAAMTSDGRTLLVVKDGREVSVVLQGSGAIAWPRNELAQLSRRRFVRFDRTGIPWVVAHGTYKILPANLLTGEVAENRAEDSLATAAAGPCEIDASGRFLASVHHGTNLQIWDVEKNVSFFDVVFDVEAGVFEESKAAAQGFPLGPPMTAPEWRSPLYPGGGRAIAIAPQGRRAAIGYADGSVIAVNTFSAAIHRLRREGVEVLAEPRLLHTEQFGPISAVTRTSQAVVMVASGRLFVVSVADGAHSRSPIGVPLKGLADGDNVYSIDVVGEELRAIVGGGVRVWSMPDGRLLRRFDMEHPPAVLVGDRGYGFMWARGGQETVPLQRVDLVTGKTASWQFVPPNPDENRRSSSGWASIASAGSRCFIKVSGNGGYDGKWAPYDPETRELGAVVDFSPHSLGIDAHGSVGVGRVGRHGWALIDLSTLSVTLHHEKVPRQYGAGFAYAYDRESGRVLAQDGASRRVCVWERDARLVAELPGHNHVGWSYLRPGGERALTIDREGVVRCWKVSPS